MSEYTVKVHFIDGSEKIVPAKDIQWVGEEGARRGTALVDGREVPIYKRSEPEWGPLWYEQEKKLDKDAFLDQALAEIDGFDGALLPLDFHKFIVSRDGSCPYTVEELEAWLEESEEAQESQVRQGECVECGRFSSQLTEKGYCEGCVMQAAIDAMEPQERWK